MVRANAPHTIATEPRELDSRTSDGIRVQLLWHPVDGHVSVAVNDTKNGDAFELEVGRSQHALDVFHHPYAYAATNGRIRPKVPLIDRQCPGHPEPSGRAAVAEPRQSGDSIALEGEHHQA